MSSKTLSDEEIGTIVDQKINMAVRWYNSKLSREREKATRYYNSEYPKRQHDGSSSFVSTEVYDAVEMMKAQILEVFGANQDIVKFKANGPNDIAECDIATKYTNYVIFQQNPGYDIFSDAIFDGLMARVGVAKVWWEERYEYVDEEFSGIDEQSVQGMAAQEDIDSLDAEYDEDMPGTYKGKLTRKVDKCQVRIEVINPEEFAIEAQAKGLSRKYFCLHRTLKHFDDLVQDGYSEAKLKKAMDRNDPDDLRTSPEVLARFQTTDNGARFQDDTDPGAQEASKWLLVHECYIELKRDGDEHLKLYKVVRVGSETLDIEEVDDLPFIAWSPLRIPHTFYGNNFAARVTPHQDVRTVLIRSIVDHATITNNPRYTVLQGGLTNPRELLDNRLGGIVNIRRPDAVAPLEQAPLNPFVFQTLGLLKDQNEQSTGISSLSQGLNKDAVSTQNSQGMVQDLVNLSQTRQKIIARNFANQFVVPLCLKVYDLVLKNEKKSEIVELCGNWVQVDPQEWKERKAATVSLYLGVGELSKEADKLTQMAVTWASDPQTGSLFTTQNRYKMASDIAKMRGVQNVTDYLTSPDQIPPPQPDPKVVAETQAETQKAQAALLTAQAAMKKVDMHGAIEQMKAQLTKMQQSFDNQITVRDEQRKDADTQNKIDVAQREITIAENTPAETGQVIVSPK